MASVQAQRVQGASRASGPSLPLSPLVAQKPFRPHTMFRGCSMNAVCLEHASGRFTSHWLAVSVLWDWGPQLTVS